MAELTPEIADAVAEACRAGAGEAAEALGRALDAKVTLEVGEPQTFAPDQLPEELSGSGLVVVLGVGQAAALLLVPSATGLVPDWASNPDPTGKSKLTTLAQELGMLLLPEDFLVEQFDTLYVDDLPAALSRGGPAESVAAVPLQVGKEDGSQAELWLVWPFDSAGALSGPQEEASADSAEQAEPSHAGKTQTAAGVEEEPAGGKACARAGVSAGQGSAAAGAGAGSGSAAGGKTSRRVSSPEQLPAYARSLLRIQVPVMVTLAEKRQPLSRILNLGPGSIIQFDKSCEEPLLLEVAGRPIAQGEAVKVGEKFGLRITSMILPGERFQPLRPARASQKQPG